VSNGYSKRLTTSARDTPGAAVAAAAQRPVPGAPLLDTARRAFTDGLHVTALVSAAVVVATVVLVTVSLRNVSADGR